MSAASISSQGPHAHPSPSAEHARRTTRAAAAAATARLRTWSADAHGTARLIGMHPHVLSTRVALARVQDLTERMRAPVPPSGDDPLLAGHYDALLGAVTALRALDASSASDGEVHQVCIEALACLGASTSAAHALVPAVALVPSDAPTTPIVLAAQRVRAAQVALRSAFRVWRDSPRGLAAHHALPPVSLSSYLGPADAVMLLPCLLVQSAHPPLPPPHIPARAPSIPPLPVRKRVRDDTLGPVHATARRVSDAAPTANADPAGSEDTTGRDARAHARMPS